MNLSMISNKIVKKMKKIHVELLFFCLKKGGGASIWGNTNRYTQKRSILLSTCRSDGMFSYLTRFKVWLDNKYNNVVSLQLNRLSKYAYVEIV